MPAAAGDRRPRRVVLVDDDEWVRRGRAAALDERDDIEVVATLSPTEALDWGDRWADCDVVLVDAFDETTEFDHFPGVAVVRSIRDVTSEPVVVAVTGHVLNNLLRVRMADAGADYFYAHVDVRTVDELAQVVLEPDAARLAATLDADGRAELATDGLSPTSDLDAGLNYVDEAGLQPALSGDPQKALPFTRRQLITARVRLARLIGVDPERSGHQDAAVPSWDQLSRVLNRARGEEKRRP